MAVGKHTDLGSPCIPGQLPKRCRGKKVLLCNALQTVAEEAVSKARTDQNGFNRSCPLLGSCFCESSLMDEDVAEPGRRMQEVGGPCQSLLCLIACVDQEIWHAPSPWIAFKLKAKLEVVVGLLPLLLSHLPFVNFLYDSASK